MSSERKRVCPVERAGGLDNPIRRWLQNPKKILGPYIREGMTVLDVGCGPGFFSLELAEMVGKSGRVIAADLQGEMLERVKGKTQGTELEERITLHTCEASRIGVSDTVDFILAFYVVHEVPHEEDFLHEAGAILKPNGRMLIVEPPFHVSTKAFQETIRKAREAGFMPVERPKVLFSKAVVLQKGYELPASGSSAAPGP
jgi:ubiquinone/menaquinone biosynthesis C-methylase UbiE